MNTKEPSQKNKHVLILYTLLLKQKGSDARYIARSKLYSDVAKFFYIKKSMASKIICGLQRSGYSPSKLDYEEFYEYMNGLNSIVNGDER